MNPTTAEEWLEWFSADEALEPHEWLNCWGSIRSGSSCPLTVSENRIAGEVYCTVIRGASHLSNHQRQRIAMAADNDEGHEPALRARLLTICGLEGR